MKEIFKPIPGYLGYYSISNKGRVLSLGREVVHTNGFSYEYEQRFMKISKVNGYDAVKLSKDGKQKMFYIKRALQRIFPPKK